jgi:hypothetical protein
MAKKTNRVVEAILETSSDLHRLGIMDDAAYRKIVTRHMSDVKTICTEQDHAEAIAEAEQLWDSPQGTPEADRLNALMTSIDAYESKFLPNAETIAAMEAGERGEVTCVDSIEALMAELKTDN